MASEPPPEVTLHSTQECRSAVAWQTVDSCSCRERSHLARRTIPVPPLRGTSPGSRPATRHPAGGLVRTPLSSPSAGTLSRFRDLPFKCEILQRRHAFSKSKRLGGCGCAYLPYFTKSVQVRIRADLSGSLHASKATYLIIIKVFWT